MSKPKIRKNECVAGRFYAPVICTTGKNAGVITGLVSAWVSFDGKNWAVRVDNIKRK